MLNTRSLRNTETRICLSGLLWWLVWTLYRIAAIFEPGMVDRRCQWACGSARV